MNKKKMYLKTKKRLTLTGYKRSITSFFGVISGILARVIGLSGTAHVTAVFYRLGLLKLMVIITTVFFYVYSIQ